MGQTDLLRLRVELARLAPNESILKVRSQAAVDTVTNRLDSSACPQADWVAEVWLLSALLCVDPGRRSVIWDADMGVVATHLTRPSSCDRLASDMLCTLATHLPNGLQEPVDAEIQLTTDHDCPSIALARHAIQSLHGNTINLVDNSQGRDVLACSEQDVDKLVSRNLGASVSTGCPASCDSGHLRPRGSSRHSCGL